VTYCHQDATDAHVWAESLSDTSTFPENTEHPIASQHQHLNRVVNLQTVFDPATEYIPILIPVHDTRHNRMRIAAGADYQEQHKQQRSKVEKSRLGEHES
jgi:hypothetical protein